MGPRSVEPLFVRGRPVRRFVCPDDDSRYAGVRCRVTPARPRLSGYGLFRKVLRPPAPPATYTEKLSPQPHCDFAFGLFSLNIEAMKLDSNTSSLPLR